MAKPTKETGIPNSRGTVDFANLDDEAKKALRHKARERADKKAREEAEEAYLAKIEEEEMYSARERMGTLGNEEKVDITLDLAPNTSFLMVNTKRYYHGQTYKDLPKSLADDLRSMQFQGWKQEKIRLGEGSNPYGINQRAGA